MKLLLLLALLSVNAQARDPWHDQDGDLMPTVSVGLGSTGSFHSLEIMDFSNWDQLTKSYGFRRYGYGRGGVQIGNGLGMYISGMAGLTLTGLKPEESGVAMHFGLDTGGSIVLNTNSSVRSHYEWLPGIFVGPQFGNNYFRCALGLKGGMAMGNFDMYSLLPNFHPSYGAGLYLDADHFSVNLDYLNFGNNRLRKVDLVGKPGKIHIGLRLEMLENMVDPRAVDNRGSLLFKLPIF